VRDLKLILNSAFATADFHGAGIANLAGDLKGQLQKVQSELGQFVDFGGKQYAGDFDVAIANNGDLTSPGGTAHASTTATLTNLKLGDDVNQPWVQAAFKADLHRGNPEFVDTVKNILVTLQSGNPQSPTVDVYATANADLTGAAKADFHLSRANIDLVKARAEFTKMFPPDLFISGGNVAMTADGAYDGAAKRADITAVTLAARDATIQRQASDGRRVDLLHNYTLNMNTAARADLSNGMAVQVPKLSVTDSQQMQLNVTDVDLQLSKPTSPGQPAAEQNPLDKLRSAKLALLVPDLKQLQALANTFSQSSAPAPSPVDPKAAPPTTQPLPPLEITSGSLAMHADVSHSGSALALNVSDITGKDIAFHRGDVAYQVKPITMQLAASVEPGDGKTTTKPIQKIQVTQLSGNLGVATLSMPTPIVVTGLDAASPSANGGIKIDGHLQDVTQLLAALQAKTADAYPYRGDFAVTENIGSSASGINVNGGVNVAKFQVLKGNDVQFAEDQLVLANDVSMASDYNSVAIKNVSANMQSSGALNVALRNGTVDDLKSARRMNLGVDLQYDLAKLWPIIHPMLLTPGQEDQYKDLKLAGQFKKVIVLKGQYPTDVPMQQAIRQLSADADLAVGLFDYNGMHIENLDVPISLRDGKASTIYADKPTGQNAAPPAVANQGKLDLSNITIDLTQDPPPRG
ncbi:MAG TPA: hypothetical protein VLI90_02770, partial [Tepidisphaeraceae bacterium]|nr:hypothetical protein [Tepidisphaeraceae bacterium]